MMLRALIFAAGASFLQFLDASCAAEGAQVFIGHAHECPRTRGNPYQLCLPDQPVSRRATEILSEKLSKATDKPLLCALDAVVIRSLIVCWEPTAPPRDPFNLLPPPESDETRDLENDLVLSEVVTELADAWVRQGNLERAASLFAGANNLAALHDNHVPLIRDSVLKKWLAFEIGRGQFDEALEVAQKLSAIQRYVLEQSRHWPASDLVEALKIEADLLDRLGRRDEAEERRREADSLAVAPQ